MKRKQNCPVQPRQAIGGLEVRKEIEDFLAALDSYPARVATQPNITFYQHLRSIFATDGLLLPGRARHHN